MTIRSLLTTTLLGVGLLGAATSSALAGPDYVCKGDRVEKGGSTQFTLRRSGGDITVEKGGSSKAKAVRRGDKLVVEVGGSSKATIAKGKIEKGGSSWSTVDEARKQFDCDGEAAATLWVLFKLGVLP